MCKMLADIKKTRQLFKIIWLFACNRGAVAYERGRCGWRSSNNGRAVAVFFVGRFFDNRNACNVRIYRKRVSP